MFELLPRGDDGTTGGGPHRAVGTPGVLVSALAVGGVGSPSEAEIGTWTTALGTVSDDEAGLGEADLIERIAAQEQLKSAASAAQARYAVMLEQRIRGRRAARDSEESACRASEGDRLGRVPREVDPGVEAGHALALARGESPSRGGRLLGLAKALVCEMPHTLNALATGRINEWRATLVVGETACLDVADRVRVDEAMVPLYAREGIGDRQLAAEARAHAQRLDPAAAVKRARRAVAERRVSVRPAPDSMAHLTCLLPAAQAIAAYAALCRHADTARATGGLGSEGRTRDQIIADTLVERVTGQARADVVRIGVNLVMSDAALLGGSTEPVVLPGYGVVPAQIGRDLVRSAPDATLRRVYAAPETGALVALDSRSRAFPAGLKAFIALRDRTCRNPWCDAPLRQIDHIRPAARGGPTTAENGQGLCEHCNQVKEAPGWTHGTAPATRHTVTVTTPTGQRYSSTGPPLPGHREIIGHRVDFPGGVFVFHTAA